MIGATPYCLKCIHLLKKGHDPWQCKAFPERIPQKFIMGEPHDKIESGQKNSFIFEENSEKSSNFILSRAQSLAARMVNEVLYFYKESKHRMVRRQAGEKDIFFSKFRGGDEFKIDGLSDTVNDAWDNWKEVTYDDYTRF